VLLRQKNGEHVRVYLWVGTRDEAKKANCLMDLDEPIGKFVFVKTTIPHDIELYTKFEIIEESTDGMFADDQVSMIVASSPMDVKKASDEVYAAVIQKGVERFAIELMSSDMQMVAVYLTNRKQRRGLPTIFEEKDILIGNVEFIRSLGEEEDSGSDESGSEDSDYEVATSDHAEAAEFLLPQILILPVRVRVPNQNLHWTRSTRRLTRLSSCTTRSLRCCRRRTECRRTRAGSRKYWRRWLRSVRLSTRTLTTIRMIPRSTSWT
jgi:hypothetical protein